MEGSRRESRPSPAQIPTPIPCRVVAFWSLIQTCCLAAHLNRPHESARSAGKGLSIIVVPEHHESADNDHGGVSEANDSCWQQNPAEVQQNSSKWGQRIGWTVSKSTRVRWGTEFVHPIGLGMTPGSTLIPGAVTVTVMSWEAPSHLVSESRGRSVSAHAGKEGISIADAQVTDHVRVSAPYAFAQIK